MSKQQRHERRKTERARRTRALARHPTSHIRHKGAMALAAAAAIAAGTSAYAGPVRFENPVGPGHFEWFGGAPPAPITLDITLDATNQSGAVFGATSFRQFSDGSKTPVFGFASGTDLQMGGPYGYFAVGVETGQLIPSGPSWGDYGFVYYPGFGSQLPENQTTYLGVRFPVGGGTHYGWIGVVRTGIELDAFAWGYETDPGIAIAAGVPEPGTLALLALGAVGLSTRRRRRQMAN